jgi:hypothetical protein
MTVEQRAYWFLGTVVLFVGSLTLLIAAYASAVQGTSVAVPILTVLVATTSLISMLLQLSLDRFIQRKDKSRDDKSVDEALLPTTVSKKLLMLMEIGLRPSAQSISLFFGPSIALFLIILLRLAAGADNFGGNPGKLDFGPKNGVSDNEGNIAFVNEFNTYGHCLQGALAAMFAFPAVSGIVTQILTCRYKEWWAECNKPLWSLLKFTAAAMSIYPIYNLFKRFIEHGDTFAASSFCNNGLEWTCGFMAGLAFGNLITVVIRLAMTRKMRQNGQEMHQVLERLDGQSWVLGTQAAPGFQPKLNVVQFLIGMALIFTAFAAAALIGLTWHSCIEGSDDDCINYSPEGVPTDVLATFLMIPSVVIVALTCGECVRLRLV